MRSRGKIIFAGFGILLTVVLSILAVPNAALRGQAAYPTHDQCFAKLRQKYAGTNTAFINPCPSDTRWCPGHGPGVPLCIPKSRQEKAAEEADRLRKARAEAEIRAEIDRLGAHREAEIRRKFELRDRALAARPKAPPTPPKQCTTQRASATQTWVGKSQVEAQTLAQRGTRSVCAANRQLSASSPVCVAKPAPRLPRPRVGDCLSCVSEQMAGNLYGWKKGVGYPPVPPPQWECKVTAQCEVEKCTAGPSGATRQ